MKANVKLNFFRWHSDGEQPPLELASKDEEQNTGAAAIPGTINLDVDKLYDLMKAQQEQGKKGLFILEIVD